MVKKKLFFTGFSKKKEFFIFFWGVRRKKLLGKNIFFPSFLFNLMLF